MQSRAPEKAEFGRGSASKDLPIFAFCSVCETKKCYEGLRIFYRVQQQSAIDSFLFVFRNLLLPISMIFIVPLLNANIEFGERRFGRSDWPRTCPAHGYEVVFPASLQN